jgi:DNA-binding response OmpR family regulator
MLILLVAQRAQSYESLCTSLKAEGHNVTVAVTGAEAIDLIHQNCVDLGIVELSLPDIAGLSVLRELRRVHSRASAYAVSTDASIDTVVAAMKLGMTNCIGTPIDCEALLSLIRTQSGVASITAALTSHASALPVDAHTPAARRWAALVHAAMSSVQDPKTRIDLARAAGVSVSTLENRCRAAGVGTKATLDLVRLLWALVKAKRQHWAPESFIDADPRTVRRLMAAAGGKLSDETSVESFLSTQRFVREGLVLDALVSMLRRMPLSSVTERDDSVVTGIN